MSTFQLLNKVTEILVIRYSSMVSETYHPCISAASENSEAGAQTCEMGTTTAALHLWY
jgi:hypothetical protein